jgi:MFS family permease
VVELKSPKKSRGFVERLGAPYRRLWWAGAVDNTGNGVWSAILPLLGATLTNDPRLISLLSVATFLPWLLFSLPVGALVDRLDQVKLMWRSQVAQFLVVAVVAIAVAAGSADIILFCVAGFLLGAGDTVFDNASQAVVPNYVRPDLLVVANTRLQVGQSATRSLLGPVIGALLYGVSAAVAIIVDALSFVVSAAILARLPRPVAVIPPDSRRRSVRGDVLEGLRWLGRHRLLRTLAAVFAVNCFCTQFAQAVLVLLVMDIYHLPAGQYGLLLAAIAGFGMLGSLVNPRLVRWLGAIGATLLSLALSALAFVAIAWAPDVLVLGALLVVNAFGTALWNVSTVSLRQRLVPREMLGRVSSTFRMVGWGLLPLGAAAGGFVSDQFGLTAVYPVAGVLRTIALLAVVPILYAYRKHPAGLT